MASLFKRIERAIEPGRLEGLRGQQPADDVRSAGSPTRISGASGRGRDLAARTRAALWGCLVGVLIGLALSELWPG